MSYVCWYKCQTEVPREPKKRPVLSAHMNEAKEVGTSSSGVLIDFVKIWILFSMQ